MAGIKYQYAYDENNNLVSIRSLTKETSKQHNFKCLGCKNELRARAIGSVKVTPHFYHMKECNYETYLHRLGKELIERKFNQNNFTIKYKVEKSCSTMNCVLRNEQCFNISDTNEVNLKEYYDTCEKEKVYKTFRPDILLTSVDNPDSPIFIEIRVTSSCSEDKLDSGIRIIEIRVKEECQLLKILEGKILEEKEYADGSSVSFINFKKKKSEHLEVKVQRYIFRQEDTWGSMEEATCQEGKRYEDSVVELNVHGRQMNEKEIALSWMAKYKGLKRCDSCSEYYRDGYSWITCHLGKHNGYPKTTFAEECEDYKFRGSIFLDLLAKEV